MPANSLEYTARTLVMNQERDDGLFVGNLDAMALIYRIGRDTVQRGNNLPVILHLAYREYYQPVEQCDTNAPHFSRVLIFRKSLCQIKAAQ